MKKNNVKPVLKWVGGKRQLLDKIDSIFPKEIDTYYEPFFGGGAVLFHYQFKKAVVNDINSELINVYNTIKTDVTSLISDLENHKNEKEYFYNIRSLDREKEKFESMSQVEKASRTLYLNKTCFNGLFRVNMKGEFNTPFGNYKRPNIVNKEVLLAVSEYLNNNKIYFLNSDFFDVVKDAKEGDFVYFDPPYDPISESSNFTSYSKEGFNKEDQLRLKQLCDDLDSKNVNFLLSNSATPFILELYSGYNVEVVKARRSINSNGNKRGSVDEVLVRNYE